MTDLDMMQSLIDYTVDLGFKIDLMTNVTTYLLLTVMFFYFRWEMKGGTFRR